MSSDPKNPWKERKLSMVVSICNPSDGEAGGRDSRSLGCRPPPSLVHEIRIQVNERTCLKTKDGWFLRINTPGCLSPSIPINRIHVYPYQCKCRHIHGTLNNTERQTDRGGSKYRKPTKLGSLKGLQPWFCCVMCRGSLCSHRLPLQTSSPGICSITLRKGQREHGEGTEMPGILHRVLDLCNFL